MKTFFREAVSTSDFIYEREKDEKFVHDLVSGRIPLKALDHVNLVGAVVKLCAHIHQHGLATTKPPSACKPTKNKRPLRP